MILVACSREYWSFVGRLRANPKVKDGFCERAVFDEEKQIKYMKKNSKYFYICLIEGKPVGYIGLISSSRDEVTFCVNPEYQGRGIGSFMVKKLMQMSINIWAKVKHNNIGSIHIFEKLGFTRENKIDFVYFTKSKGLG